MGVNMIHDSFFNQTYDDISKAQFFLNKDTGEVTVLTDKPEAEKEKQLSKLTLAELAEVLKGRISNSESFTNKTITQLTKFQKNINTLNKAIASHNEGISKGISKVWNLFSKTHPITEIPTKELDSVVNAQSEAELEAQFESKYMQGKAGQTLSAQEDTGLVINKEGQSLYHTSNHASSGLGELSKRIEDYQNCDKGFVTSRKDGEVSIGVFDGAGHTKEARLAAGRSSDLVLATLPPKDPTFRNINSYFKKIVKSLDEDKALKETNGTTTAVIQHTYLIPFQRVGDYGKLAEADGKKLTDEGDFNDVVLVATLNIGDSGSVIVDGKDVMVAAEPYEGGNPPVVPGGHKNSQDARVSYRVCRQTAQIITFSDGIVDALKGERFDDKVADLKKELRLDEGMPKSEIEKPGSISTRLREVAIERRNLSKEQADKELPMLKKQIEEFEERLNGVRAERKPVYNKLSNLKRAEAKDGALQEVDAKELADLSERLKSLDSEKEALLKAQAKISDQYLLLQAKADGDDILIAVTPVIVQPKV